MTLATVPDIERVVADYLRAHADIIALGTSVRVTTPTDKTTSWVRITKLSAPQVNQPDHLLEAMLQFDCYAGATGGVPEATTLERTVRAVLGTLPGARQYGTVTGVQIIDSHRGVDTDIEPARDRVDLTALIWCHA